MTPHSSFFSSYIALSGNQYITVANGSNTSVTGHGNIHLQPSFPLKNVLHDPKLSNNFLSIQKVIQDLNCAVVFFPSYCIFQDLSMRKTIGIAKSKAGYIIYSMKKIKSVLDYRHTHLIFSKAVNLGHPLKYGFNTDVLVILHLVP